MHISSPRSGLLFHLCVAEGPHPAHDSMQVRPCPHGAPLAPEQVLGSPPWAHLQDWGHAV